MTVPAVRLSGRAVFNDGTTGFLSSTGGVNVGGVTIGGRPLLSLLPDQSGVGGVKLGDAGDGVAFYGGTPRDRQAATTAPTGSFVASDVTDVTAATPALVATADATAPSAGYVQAEVASIRALANENKRAVNEIIALLTDLKSRASESRSLANEAKSLITNNANSAAEVRTALGTVNLVRLT